MLKKYLFTVSIIAIILSTFITTDGQENTEKIENKISQQEDMQKYMEFISSDGTMRVQMMNLIIQNSNGNKNAMMEIGQTMINNPEMRKIIKKMVNENESMELQPKNDGISKEHMIMESTKKIMKPKYDSDQK